MINIGTGIRAVITAGLIGAVAVPAQASCITQKEVRADQVRFLDMQLRVAALRCRFENPKFASLYNGFVRKHKGAIQASRKPVEGYLSRLTTLSMDRYVTRTANQISRHSMKVKNFCALNAAVARLAATENDPLMVMNLLPVAYENRHQVCRKTPEIDPVIAADADYPAVEAIQP